MRQSFSGPATFLTFSVLGLPKGGIPARYVRVLAVFAVSGVYHIYIDMCYGISLAESGAFRFFICQGLGIILEDAFRFSYHHFRDKWCPVSSASFGVWERWIGYPWTLCWLTWTTPALLYPMALQNEKMGQSGVLPFSIISIVRKLFST